ncbi:MAG TPA: 2-hydroxyacyl-CoA dehydratase family protein [Steroidobacteraceae bacterium]|nr:2-hydroxyacyl-CoA dehydratase family protein [Steroidobacteraceae bacterium]
MDAHIEHLLHDPLAAAREAKQQRQRVIGYIGDIPVELIFAANALPVRLRGVAGANASRAEQYLDSSFVPETRAILEQWLCGQLNFLDAVIFPRSDDSAQRLYYYICELQRTKRCDGPAPLLFDVATIPRHTSLDHTIDSMRRLATALSADLTKLPAAIERVKQRRQSIDKLPPGSESFNLARAAEYDWRNTFDTLLRTSTSTTKAARVVFAGSAPPDARMHRAVESTGGVIAAEFTDIQLGPMNGNDPLTALAERHHRVLTPAQAMLHTPQCLVKLARRTHAKGAVLWAIEEDEALPWEIARQAQILKAANIPVLLLTRQKWLADDATLNVIAQFVRGLESR